MTLSVDASSPAVSRGSTTTTSTASFSPPANSLIAVFLSSDADSGATDETCTVTSTGGLTWTLAVRSNAGVGADTEIWTAPCTTAPGAITVSATDNKGAVAKSIFVRVFVDSNGATPSYANASGVATNTDTLTYTSSAANSWCWATGIGSGGPIAGTGSTLQDSTVSNFDGGDSLWTNRLDSTTATAGSSVSITTAGSNIYHHCVIEILPGVVSAVKPGAFLPFL